MTVEEAAETGKKLLIIFESNGINVIRIRLQPTENILPGKDVVAGPFHPSMRQLVEALVYRDMLTILLERIGGNEKEVIVKVNPRNISELVGNKKSNIKYIKEKFSIDKITISQDKYADKDTIVLVVGEKSIGMSKKVYYSIYYK
jgi:hypothetical protein